MDCSEGGGVFEDEAFGEAWAVVVDLLADVVGIACLTGEEKMEAIFGSGLAFLAGGGVSAREISETIFHHDGVKNIPGGLLIPFASTFPLLAGLTDFTGDDVSPSSSESTIRFFLLILVCART